MALRMYHPNGNDHGWITIRKNDGVDKAQMGPGFCVRLFTAAGTFVRYAGTWRLQRDAVAEAESLGFTIRRKS